MIVAWQKHIVSSIRALAFLDTEFSALAKHAAEFCTLLRSTHAVHRALAFVRRTDYMAAAEPVEV
jgi:hypothetical protein